MFTHMSDTNVRYSHIRRSSTHMSYAYIHRTHIRHISTPTPTTYVYIYIYICHARIRHRSTSNYFIRTTITMLYVTMTRFVTFNICYSVIEYMSAAHYVQMDSRTIKYSNPDEIYVA